MRCTYFTNQQKHLPAFLADATITDEMLRNATVDDPLSLFGADVDMTEHQGAPMIHFCRSIWQMPGTSRINAKQHEWLTHQPLVRLMVEPPPHGKRYNVTAALYFDSQQRAAIFLITSFFNPQPIPEGVQIQLEGERRIDVAVPFLPTARRRVETPELACCST